MNRSYLRSGWTHRRDGTRVNRYMQVMVWRLVDRWVSLTALQKFEHKQGKLHKTFRAATRNW